MQVQYMCDVQGLAVIENVILATIYIDTIGIYICETFISHNNVFYVGSIVINVLLNILGLIVTDFVTCVCENTMHK